MKVNCCLFAMTMVRCFATAKSGRASSKAVLEVKALARDLLHPAPVRLDRTLCSRGAWSRSETADLLKKGRVKVDGQVVRSSSEKVSFDVPISVDGQTFPHVPILAVYNKPVGVQCTIGDPYGRPNLSTLFDLNPILKTLHPVGRLDADTSGLLILSGLGRLTTRLLNPEAGIPRVYDAIVAGEVDHARLEASLLSGVQTTDGQFRAHLLDSQIITTDEGVARLKDVARAQAVLMGKSDNEVEIAILNAVTSCSRVRLSVTEGKYRMIRRMLHNTGHSVLLLHRRSYGGLNLAECVSSPNGGDVTWPPTSGVNPGQVHSCTKEELSGLVDVMMHSLGEQS